MKFLLIIAPLLLTIAMACGKKLQSSSTQLEGTFEGTFNRSSPTARYASAKVSLTISGETFSGTSDIANYPAICSGKLKLANNKMMVENDCMFTADFDWSLVFKGEYVYEYSNDELRITKRMANSVVDQYILKKK